MNLAEKILAAHTDRKQVSPGEFVNARVDVILGNDITAPIAIKEFQKLGLSHVLAGRLYRVVWNLLHQRLHDGRIASRWCILARPTRIYAGRSGPDRTARLVAPHSASQSPCEIWY